MAFSLSVSEKTTFGNMNVVMGVVTADATTGSVSVPFGVIRHVDVSPKSATSGYKVRLNVNASGVAANGTLAITGCTSGDELFVTVFGA
jgi:hypothetical protein